MDGAESDTLAIGPGSHTIRYTDPQVAFYAGQYGQVQYDSYGFPAGRIISLLFHVF